MPDPRRGDKVYSYSRYDQGRNKWGYVRNQPNGYIVSVQPWNDNVCVYYYDGDIESLSLSAFDSGWTDKFGGLWFIGD